MPRLAGWKRLLADSDWCPGDPGRNPFPPEGRYLVTANANGLAYLLRLAGPGEMPHARDPGLE